MILLSLLRGIAPLARADRPTRPAPRGALRVVPRPVPRLELRAAMASRLPLATVLAVVLAAPCASALPAADGWTEAMAAFKAGRYEIAADSFRAGAEADPDEPRWQYMLGVSLTKAGREAEAVTSLERAVELTRDETGRGEGSYAVALAQAQLRSGDPDVAFATLAGNQPGEARPDLRQAWAGLLAATAARMEDPQPAVPLLIEAVERADGADLRLALGRAYAAAGDAASAFTHYAAAAASEARALRPAMDAAFAAAEALAEDDHAGRSGWYRRAAALAAAQPVAGFPAATLLIAGDALLLDGRPAAAEERFRAALEAEPTSALAAYQIARCRLAQDDPAGALARVAELSTAPGSELGGRVLAVEAQALAGLERWEEAAAAYRRAGKEDRAAEMEEVVAALAHNRGVEAAAEKCRQRWADIARLRDENRDVEGTAAWTEIDRRAERLAAECGPEPVKAAAG